jgi:hypothetical protein
MKIMKQMYKQPQTDVAVINTANLMDITTMSTQGSGGGGETEAPARHGDIID